MSEQVESIEEPAVAPASIPRFGAATPVVATIGLWLVAIASWWLLADPEWSLSTPSTPLLYALLFWTILGFLVTGFTFGGYGFDRIAQPLAGVLQVIVNVAFGLLGVWVFSYIVGSWDPTFSHDSPGGSGYLATAFVVLIGFYAFALVAASWGGFPFESIAPPLNGIAMFYQSAFITLIGVVWLVYPNFSPALAATAPVSLATALGWVYSSIVIAIMGAMVWENRPWSLIENRVLRALGALVTTLGGGYCLFLVFKGLAELLVPNDIQDLATFSAASEAAQIGVCFSLWALTWGLLFGAAPTKFSPAANLAARTAIVSGLAIATYVIFMHGFATKVLHMPAMRDSYGGDPLMWINWLILAVLWYAVAFGAFGSSKSTD